MRAPRLPFVALLGAALALFACADAAASPVERPALALAAAGSPCALVPNADALAPIAGQPDGVHILGAVGTQAVAVWRTRDSASVCLGRAELQSNGKSPKWQAVVATKDGTTVAYKNFASREKAVIAVWERSTAQLPPAPVQDSTPAPPSHPVDTTTSAPLPALDSLAAWIGSAPIVASAQVRAMGPAFARYDSATVAAAEVRWALEGANWGDDYYDRGVVFYALCGRTGDATWCARGDSMAVHYRDDYLVPGFGQNAPSAHWSMLQSVYAHAKRTGSDASRYAVARAAENLWGGWANYMGAPALVADSAHMTRQDPRIHGRVLLAQELARDLGGHPSVGVQAWGAAPSYQARIDTILAGLAKWQPATGARAGAWPTDFACGGQNNFEAGILHDALIRTHTRDAQLTAAQRATIVALVARGVGYLWGQFTPSGGFPYGDLALTGQATCATDNGTQISPDLTGLMVAPFGWLYRQTGDAGWRARGESVFAQLVTGWALGEPFVGNGSKQFNQATATSWQYLGWR
jgi:hypothetical protein